MLFLSWIPRENLEFSDWTVNLLSLCCTLPLQAVFAVAILQNEIHSSSLCLQTHILQGANPSPIWITCLPLASVPCFYSCTQPWHQQKTLLDRKQNPFTIPPTWKPRWGGNGKPLPLHSCYQQLNQWRSLYSLPKMSRGQERAALLRSCSSLILWIGTMKTELDCENPCEII